MDLINFYHRLPAPARSLAASLRGWHLTHWRYGAETEGLIEEALDRETWSWEQWECWQGDRLARQLHHAATRVPYYQKYWSLHRRPLDCSPREELSSWPILDKESVRQNPHAFVANNCNVRRMYVEHTSGTTGKPLSVWWPRETVRQWFALFEARWRRWYGVTRHDRWANIGGQLITPVWQKKPPFWVWNSAMRQLCLSSYHLSPEFIPNCLQALVNYRVEYLFGYTSSLFALAKEALQRGLPTPDVRVAITNAEPLLAHQREVIEQAFDCPVRETYGMSEIVTAAGECEQGRLHLWPEAGVVEVFNGDRKAAAGTVGEFVATSLINAGMPLIRYRLGDRGCMQSGHAICPCGRSLPCLAALEGRCDDVLWTREGAQIGRLDPVFKADLPIREAQIIQESLDRVRVKYVPTTEYTADAGKSIVARLHDRMGSIEVVLEGVDAIPRKSAGKFQAVVSHLTPEEQELARRSM